jgi:Uma2 family endonuclease
MTQTLAPPTWRKKAELKGLEADDCYHIQHIQQVAGKTELDLTIDPPPDLAIEVEVASPMINKLEVYRGLKVPELWRIKANGSCEMYLLDAEGAYQPILKSVAIPILTPAIVSHYVLMREQQSHGETLRRFDAEVLANVAS